MKTVPYFVLAIALSAVLVGVEFPPSCSSAREPSVYIGLSRVLYTRLYAADTSAKRYLRLFDPPAKSCGCQWSSTVFCTQPTRRCYSSRPRFCHIVVPTWSGLDLTEP